VNQVYPDRPTRATVAGRAYLDLQNLARKQHRPTDELHQLYALEGFLTRLASSPYAGRFVLKGGVLLAAYDARRPTRDIDMQAQAIANERETIPKLVRDIAERMTADFAHNLDHALSGLPPDNTAGTPTSLDGVALLRDVLRQRARRLLRNIWRSSPSPNE